MASDDARAGEVVDQAVRDRVSTDLDQTFLVEAGAGTGKTSILVRRYIACLRKGCPTSRVAAITFTEKAAGELRTRIRLGVEEALEGGLSEQERASLRAALAAIDDAPISTIHGFAARLLRERPVEAGIDPAFRQLDAIEAGLLLDELWSSFVLNGLDDIPGAGAALDDVLGAGVSLATVREAVIGPAGLFHQRYDLQAPAPSAAPDLHASLGEIRRRAEELLDYCGAACCDDTDLGYDLACRAVAGAIEVCDQPAADLHALAAQLAALPLWKPGPGGRQASWGGKAGKDTFVGRYEALRAAWQAAWQPYAAFVAARGEALAHAFIAYAEREQRQLGVLDFADLLGKLRDLLVGRPDVRADFQSSFDHLLVDEFQDTDPLQAEIVFLLAEDGARATDWREARLKPGKLFIVGDPKQSIYRFRRADIAMYDEVKRLLREGCGEESRQVIEQNFRTVGEVVEWANEVFSQVIGDDAHEGRQPGYEKLTPARPPAADGARVTVLYGPDAEGLPASDAHRLEADECAALLREAHDGGDLEWRVRTKTPAGEAWHEPAWSDIALLFRSFSNLESYEQAFRRAGIPYRVDGGRTYFERREVGDTLLALRCIDDAADGPAVYGTLRSSLFGFSDEQLVLFKAAGGVFDYLAEEQPQDQPVVAALALLRELHTLRLEVEPHQLVLALLARTRELEFHAARGGGGRQAIGNLEKLVDRARAFSGAEGGSLGAFVRWAASAADTGDEAESAGEEPGDVVRIMTVHKAKGLEFPIVVVAAGTHKTRADGRPPLLDRRRRRAELFLGATPPGGANLPSSQRYGFATLGYEALLEREAEMTESERRRLFYVAATRACDHLVLVNVGEPDPACLLQPFVGWLPAQGSVDAPHEQGRMLLRRARPLEAVPRRDEAPSLDGLLGGRARWREEHDRALEAAAVAAVSRTPSALERLDPLGAEAEDGAVALRPPGRGGALALGEAVHRAMELCDLNDAASVGPAGAIASVEAGIEHRRAEVERLALACWHAPPVREAAASSSWRELPVVLALDDGLLQGAVDLVFSRDDGYVVVDYKTDRDADLSAAERRYAPQLGAYAVALEAALGAPVVEAWVVMAAGKSADGAAPAACIAVTDELRSAAWQSLR